jgi:hypothetical protein
MDALHLTIVSSAEPATFCRRLSSVVNQSPMHLSRVLETAVQIYPVRVDSFSGQAVVRTCELRMRHAGAPLTEDVADQVVARVQAAFEVTEVRWARPAGQTTPTGSPGDTTPGEATAA